MKLLPLVRALQAATPRQLLMNEAGPLCVFSDHQLLIRRLRKQYSFSRNNGTSSVSVGKTSYTSGDVCKLTFVIDTSAKTVDFYINDELVASDVAFSEGKGADEA